MVITYNLQSHERFLKLAVDSQADVLHNLHSGEFAFVIDHGTAGHLRVFRYWFPRDHGEAGEAEFAFIVALMAREADGVGYMTGSLSVGAFL